MTNISTAELPQSAYNWSSSPEFEPSNVDTVAYLSSNGTSSGKSTRTWPGTGASNANDTLSDDSDNLPVGKIKKKVEKLESSSESSSWDTSDEEPLEKYKKDPVGRTDASEKRGVGRPKGRARPPRCDFSRPQSICQHKVC